MKIEIAHTWICCDNHLYCEGRDDPPCLFGFTSGEARLARRAGPAHETGAGHSKHSGLNHLMDIRQLTPQYFVSPQIAPEDMDAIKAAGITCILCNRPDGEVPPSHQTDAMRAAATAAGLRFEAQPLTHQTMVPEVIAQNHALGAQTDDVILAYCASGTRSTIAWALAHAGALDADAILSAARNGGYDLENMRGTLQQAFI